MKIYIAGPYSAPTRIVREANTRRAMDAALALMGKGHYPYCPHISHYLDERNYETTGEFRAYHEWIELDDAFQQECDGFLYLGPSRGADRELQQAKGWGQTIFYSLDEVPQL